MINLLKYYAKKRINVLVVLSAILILLMFVFVANNFVRVDDKGTQSCYNNPLTFITVVACILSTIVPMFEFSFKMKKVGIDLTTTNEKLYITKYIVGIVEILIPMFILCLTIFLKIEINEHIFNMKYYWLYVLCLLPSVVLLYSIVAFVFSRCNTIYDGIICVLGVIFIIPAALSIIENILDLVYVIDNEYFFLEPRIIKERTIRNLNYMISNSHIYSSFTNMSLRFTKFMDNKYHTQSLGETYSYVYISILGLLSAFGIMFCSRFEKKENAKDISNSWFSYKVMLPIYIMLIGINFGVVLAIISDYIGYIVYRRTFKIKLYDIIIISSCTIFIIVVNILYKIFM